MKEKLQLVLEQNLDLLTKSAKTLNISVQKCSDIGVKSEYSFEEQESFDALTSKYSRTTDIYIQKVLRSLFNLLREPQLTIIDLSNRAEKLDIITSAKDLLEIRDLRNSIAHEYIEEIINELYQQTLNFTDVLNNCIDKTKFYIETKRLLEKK